MQHAAWVIAPLVLVGTLAFSAAAKVGKGASLRKIIRNLRLPDRILPEPLARAIPGIELALVVGLLTPWLPVFGGAAAGTLCLMVIYWALIARGLTITPRPDCGCFGQAGDHRISGRTLLRNTALVSAAAATLSLAVSGRTLWSLVSDFGAGDVLWLVLAALACLVTGLVVGRFESPPPFTMPDQHEPPAATAQPDDEDDYVRKPTPELVVFDPDTGPVTLSELATTKAQLLVFVNCYCASTRDVIAQIESWQERLGLVDVRMVFSVPIVERLIPTTPPGSLLDHRGLAWQALELADSPNALLLGVDGYLAGGPVFGPDEVTDFIDDVEDSLRAAPEAAVDTAAVDTAHGSADERTVDKVGQAEGQLTGDR
ncbi:MauE/DoxX family redox-associated membrane protein [Knoellia sp. S7-12]|uniref:MauE/DoxX family redox-associated membrane protein n=1 Tax=Knoellia sp. S7-12 TaxID=3126698 RepID=UPI0033672471